MLTHHRINAHGQSIKIWKIQSNDLHTIPDHRIPQLEKHLHAPGQTIQFRHDQLSTGSTDEIDGLTEDLPIILPTGFNFEEFTTNKPTGLDLRPLGIEAMPGSTLLLCGDPDLNGVFECFHG